MEVPLENFKRRYRYNESQDYLGKGGFSKTFTAYDKIRKSTVVLKFFNQEYAGEDLSSEVTKAINFYHTNLIKYYDFFEIIPAEGPKQPVAVLEYADRGDLTQFIDRPPRPDIFRLYLQDILHGLLELEKRQIVHQDIKLENVLLTYDQEEKRNVAKISDFGLARFYRSALRGESKKKKNKPFSGTPAYIAPELLDDRFAYRDVDMQPLIWYNLDLWGLGVMIYYIFEGRPPFGNKDSMKGSVSDVLKNIKSKEINTLQVGNIPEPFGTIVKQCLVKDAKKRIKSARDLLPLLERKSIQIGNSVSQPRRKVVIPPPLKQIKRND